MRFALKVRVIFPFLNNARYGVLSQNVFSELFIPSIPILHEFASLSVSLFKSSVHLARLFLELAAMKKTPFHNDEHVRRRRPNALTSNGAMNAVEFFRSLDAHFCHAQFASLSVC
jgi:hypothetical protein